MTNTVKSDQTNWTLADQVAFECALAHDDQEDWRVLKDRDLIIAESIPEQLWSDAQNRRSVAKHWLAERLLQTPSLKLAADSVCRSIESAGLVLCVIGGFVGIGTAVGTIAYTGQEPINVSAFFGVFILLQALLACALFIPFLLPRSVKERLFSSALFRFTKVVFNQAFKAAQTLANRFLEARHRNEVAEITGVVRSRFVLHEGMVKWLAFTKLQATALCFNFAALVVLLVAVAFSDRAFGWQTTLDVSPESIHDLVKLFASPWAWFYGEGNGYPSLADVEGSRIVLKEGIRSLKTESLVSWWPFLALGMVAYGILPRLAFRILGGFQFRLALRNYDFSNASAQRLFDRLAPVSPRFDTQDVDQLTSSEASAFAKSGNAAAISRQKVCCLLERETAASLDLVALCSVLAQKWNLPLGNVEMQTYENGAIANSEVQLDPETQYALVVESWMPPLVETERQIKALRSAIDSRSLVKIVLLGIPADVEEAISLHVADAYRNTWDAFVRRLGDPYLILDTHAS